jgi:hypothetical protein
VNLVTLRKHLIVIFLLYLCTPHVELSMFIKGACNCKVVLKIEKILIVVLLWLNMRTQDFYWILFLFFFLTKREVFADKWPRTPNLKPLAPHQYVFESCQGFWVLSYKKANQQFDCRSAVSLGHMFSHMKPSFTTLVNP